MPLARFRPRFTVRRLMVAVAVVALMFGAYDQVKVYRLASKYRRIADYCTRMEQKCRKIDAMDPVTRAREAEEAMDDPFLNDADWNRQMIPWWENMKNKYFEASVHPRRPLTPDPPHP
jgi:hypothetical protein